MTRPPDANDRFAVAASGERPPAALALVREELARPDPSTHDLSTAPPKHPEPMSVRKPILPFRRRVVETPLYRYISTPKLQRLAGSKRVLSSATISVAGIGGGISGYRTESLDQQLQETVKRLRKTGSIGTTDTTERKNFLEGRDRFCEYLMNDVVIWITRLADPPGVLLLGGSSIHLDRNNFEKEPLAGPTPGSNRSTYLNALTSLWRSALVDGRDDLTVDPYEIAEKEANAAVFENPVRVQGQVFDEIPYNHISTTSIYRYYADALSSYSWGSDLFIDDLAYVAIIHSYYIFEEARPVFHIETGDRFILGSPLYMAQMQPTGSAPA
jgi:hypothetical protein